MTVNSILHTTMHCLVLSTYEPHSTSALRLNALVFVGKVSEHENVSRDVSKIKNKKTQKKTTDLDTIKKKKNVDRK